MARLPAPQPLAVWRARVMARLGRLVRLVAGGRGACRRLSGRLRQGVHRAGAGSLARWRRSLQLRVVAITVLLGCAVVVAVGTALLDRISGGLVQERERAVEADAARAAGQAQAQFDAAAVGDAQQVADLVNTTLSQLEGAGPNRTRDVLLLRSPGARGNAVVADTYSSGILPATVTAQLRERVARVNRRMLQVASVAQDDGTSEPGIVVGSRVDVPLAESGQYQLFFVYRLDAEQQTLALVKRALLGGGAVLVLLVGGVAYMVTRLVVDPVREAARTAERLASGRLDQRMRVRGEDDLARLARSFNEMALSLQQQILRLEELSRLQRRFVSDVSHELRTPLTTIRMAGDLIHESRQDLDPTVARAAELLQAQLDRFEALLADLLEISRFDAGAAQLDVEPTHVQDVVRRVVELAEPVAAQKGGRIIVFAPSAPVVAEVDPRRLERVVRNLVLNGVEHGERNLVEVAVGADERAVAVTVRDRGVGIDPADLPRVFDRFWRADSSRTRSTGSTGLGLAIAAEDAQLHAGWLQVWGRPGRGACFRLTLPIRPGLPLVSSPLPLVPAGELPVGRGGLASAMAGLPQASPAGRPRLLPHGGSAGSATLSGAPGDVPQVPRR